MGPITFAEAYYGPTYHIKDISMQFIGQFLKYLVRKDEENDRVSEQGHLRCFVIYVCSVMFTLFWLERIAIQELPCLPALDLLIIV